MLHRNRVTHLSVHDQSLLVVCPLYFPMSINTIVNTERKHATDTFDQTVLYITRPLQGYPALVLAQVVTI